ncbi:hypothetical protein KP509_36G015400 [Ceratopteris richardii]|uniref:Uncharacterized protein n=1 Tax=Ceratopteris richardii TaxID=49495 RepID=A0A8T2Q9P7_CERRI|nr:hypothetical protein KP509_36G015400 [Ceratopteris richardii]
MHRENSSKDIIHPCCDNLLSLSRRAIKVSIYVLFTNHFFFVGFDGVKISQTCRKWYRDVRRHGLVMGHFVISVKPM